MTRGGRCPSRRCLALAVLASASFGTVPARQASDLAAIGVVQVEPGHAVLDALLADVDRSGAPDLLIAERTETGRRIAIHLREDRRAPVAPRADLALDLTPDVIAFAVADVHPDPGAEIVLWGARGVFVWRPRPPASSGQRESARFAKLFEADFLWQVPADGALFAWQPAVADLDRDGLEDLVVPEPSGYRVAFQERESGEARFRARRLSVPREREGRLSAGAQSSQGRGEAQARRGESRVGVSFGDDGLSVAASRGPLLSVLDTTPVPVLADWDADGDQDLLAQTARELCVFVQDPPGELPEHATLVLPLPFERDLGRLLDVSYSTHALDLDSDGRADCVVFAGDPRAKDVRSQGLVFTQASRAADAPPLFGAKGVPAQVLVFAGFVFAPRFADVDRDGREDLVVASFRPDLIDVVRAASSERIDTELYVYRNEGGSFARRPDLVHELSLAAEEGEHAALFVGDVTGDGLEDLCVREETDRIAVLALRRTRDGLALGDRPVWELAVDPKARLVASPAPVRGADLLIVSETQVLCASFP